MSSISQVPKCRHLSLPTLLPSLATVRRNVRLSPLDIVFTPGLSSFDRNAARSVQPASDKG